MVVSVNATTRAWIQIARNTCWLVFLLSLIAGPPSSRISDVTRRHRASDPEINIADVTQDRWFWSSKHTWIGAAEGATIANKVTKWRGIGDKIKEKRRQLEANSVDPKETEQLLRIMVEIQKRADYKAGMTHIKDEEKEVDFMFEDDIVLTVPQAEEILQDLNTRTKRKLAEPLTKRWTLPIPYAFDGSHSAEERSRIRQALAYWEELTCIDFREDTKASKKLLFVRGRGCWSYVGYTHQANQTVSIGDGCQSNGTIAHEVGHAIGFWHEQSRPDRDDYILIHKQNVTDGKFYNFQPRTWGEIITLDVPYDLGSDMHYGSKFYARDVNSTLTTVETRDPLMMRVIGQRQELSFYDVKLANKAYCEGLCSSYGLQLAEPCQRDGYQDPKNCHRCRCPDGFGGPYCETVAPSVKAYCGGVLDATYNGTIYSPGYPAPGYHADVQCSWLIKGLPGSHVYLQFVDSFGIACHIDVCKDFVEVRYNTSLALTGARFCCNEPPRHVIRSDTHEMLVLFRSYSESRVCDDVKYPWKCKQLFTGFKAKYYTLSCGGCGNRHKSVQPACTRRISYTCTQSWTENVKVVCPQWWYTQGCGERTMTKMRYATCHRDDYYCCNGFHLIGKTCRAPGVPGDRYPKTQGPPTAYPSGPLWTDWGTWSSCSVSCGGGVKVRSRKCINAGTCGSVGVQLDTRPCAQEPCYRKCQVERKILCDIWKTCTRTVYELCNPFCNNGQLLHGKLCVPMTNGG